MQLLNPEDHLQQLSITSAISLWLNNGNFHYALALYSHVYLSGCSQFKQVETRSNQLALVVARMTK